MCVRTCRRGTKGRLRQSERQKIESNGESRERERARERESKRERGLVRDTVRGGLRLTQKRERGRRLRVMQRGERERERERERYPESESGYGNPAHASLHTDRVAGKAELSSAGILPSLNEVSVPASLCIDQRGEVEQSL